MRYYFALLAGMLLLCCCAGRAAQATAVLPPVEVVKTVDGTYWLWRHSPATAADLDMPAFNRGLLMESFAYHVRDRKRRDVLYYARMRISTTALPAAIMQFYRGVLGAAAVVHTAPETGEITLASGTANDLRQVTITPQAKNCALLLERVKHYFIPPRVYNPRERQVIGVLNSVTQAYQNAQHIVYTLEQHDASITPPSTTQDYTLTMDYHRPNGLQLTLLNGTKKLTIISQADHLVVTAPDGSIKQRTIAGKITADLLPEIQDDTLARLMLGDTLITPQVDYLALEAVPNVPPSRQAELILTYPDDNAKLFLFIDLQQKTILHAEMLISGDEPQHIISVYKNVLLDVPAPKDSRAISAPQQQQQPPSGVPAAVPAP